MDWIAVGSRIRKQREYMGLSREQFAELIEVTPKFCSDIELGVKGMSVPTLCRIARAMHLSTDYILFGDSDTTSDTQIERMLHQCSPSEYESAEALLKVFFTALRKRDQE
ncbi:MAG: helix-turn-helix transcriptional regulator [Oscillospiraceae bacterium]|nr:helix-turn-helix transcriptional regulator [Oscillospiraceae bacterium]